MIEQNSIVPRSWFSPKGTQVDTQRQAMCNRVGIGMKKSRSLAGDPDIIHETNELESQNLL